MKNKLVLTMVITAIILSGCSSSNASLHEGKPKESDENTSNTTATQTSTNEVIPEDYTDQIKEEVASAKSDILLDELENVNELYDKYSLLEQNISSQSETDESISWGTMVWKEETLSLLNRIQETYPAKYDEIIEEYENWEKYIPSMAQKMCYLYEGDSSYSSKYTYIVAMRYKQKAHLLVNTIKDLMGEESLFYFPDFTPSGYYGDYTGESYIIITDGDKADTYYILIHIDEEKELRGSGYVEYFPDDIGVIFFTSDDETVEGTVDYCELYSDFYVSDTDGSIVGQEAAYSFSKKY